MDNGTISKIRDALKDIREKYFKLIFFAIVKRAEQNTWDILISGEDISNDIKTASEMIAIIKKYIPKEEITLFSRLAILEPENQFVKTFTGLIQVDNALMTLKKANINNILLDEAIVLYSLKKKKNKRPEVA